MAFSQNKVGSRINTEHQNGMALPEEHGSSQNFNFSSTISKQNPVESQQNQWKYPEPIQFSGKWNQEADIWMQEFELHVESSIKDMPQHYWLRYIARFLEGEAESWHITYVEGAKGWQNYREAFLQKFCNSSHELKARELLKGYSLVGKTVAKVYADLVVLFRKSKMFDKKEQLYCLYDKLSEEDKYDILTEKCYDFESIIGYLEVRERIISATFRKTPNPYIFKRKGNKGNKNLEQGIKIPST
ncbi:hypothetical protein BB560_001812 [Smittium megazygosporum]|uniref:Retrotransposon gag domain-containing protein n=1 Tax=Smittium megazygosporum TaxID=133381 RepID=A0A2T9ZGI5_9FUNG|nr:hypothetical protein BB560_001812 [Smittium megazygosporum]